MLRRCLFRLSLALLGTLVVAGSGGAAVRPAMIPEVVAVRHGLTSAWFNQVQMDPARSRVQHVVLCEGVLLVATDRAMLHALDAETGQTLWVQQVGIPRHPTLRPAANKELVAAVNGSYLYALNRATGKLLWKTRLEDAPGAGPALSGERVYVPMVSGMIQAYRLQPLDDPLEEVGKTDTDLTSEEEEALDARRRENLRLSDKTVIPLACKAWGRAMVQPGVLYQSEGEEFVGWPTDRGLMFVGGINRQEANAFTIRYYVKTSGEIVASPTYVLPDPAIPGDFGTVIINSRDGFVYAVAARDGSPRWRFSTGEPLVRRAVSVDPRVYVATQPGGLYALDATEGTQVWWAPKVVQFVASSNNRVYAADKIGQLHILDARNGARLDTLPTIGFTLALTNTETDRIYLASEAGLIQCLREVGLSQPIRHNQRLQPKPQSAPVTEQKPVDELQGGKAPAKPVFENPFAGGEEAAAPAGKPSRPAAKPRPKAEEEDDFGGLFDAIENADN